MTAQRKGKKQSAKAATRDIKIEQRQAEAIRLKLTGIGYRAIAAQLGVNVATAYADVQSVLDETREAAKDDAEQERRLQLERLDVMVEKLMPQLDDPDTAIAAATALRGVEERRARLLGLDGPSKHELSGPEGAPIEIDARNALLERLSGLVASAAAGSGASANPSGSDPGRGQDPST